MRYALFFVICVFCALKVWQRVSVSDTVDPNIGRQAFLAQLEQEEKLYRSVLDLHELPAFLQDETQRHVYWISTLTSLLSKGPGAFTDTEKSLSVMPYKRTSLKLMRKLTFALELRPFLGPFASAVAARLCFL